MELLNEQKQKTIDSLERRVKNIYLFIYLFNI